MYVCCTWYVCIYKWVNWDSESFSGVKIESLCQNWDSWVLCVHYLYFYQPGEKSFSSSEISLRLESRHAFLFPTSNSLGLSTRCGSPSSLQSIAPAFLRMNTPRRPGIPLRESQTWPIPQQYSLITQPAPSVSSQPVLFSHQTRAPGSSLSSVSSCFLVECSPGHSLLFLLQTRLLNTELFPQLGPFSSLSALNQKMSCSTHRFKMSCSLTSVELVSSCYVMPHLFYNFCFFLNAYLKLTFMSLMSAQATEHSLCDGCKALSVYFVVS